jgi:DNA-binding NarL/FixJ family response regulator
VTTEIPHQKEAGTPRLSVPPKRTKGRRPPLAERTAAEVLQLLTKGKTMKEAAYVLELSTHTIAFHKLRIMETLNAKNNTELVQYAIRNHIIAA